MASVDLSSDSYRLLADAVLAVHFAIVAFVVIGLPLVLLGGARGWQWVRNYWFRIAHLAAIAYVAGQAWFGVDCPLTALEQELRWRSGATPHGGSFIEYWLGRLIYYDFPPWVFLVLYTGFALAVIYAWVRVPPQKRAR